MKIIGKERNTLTTRRAMFPGVGPRLAPQAPWTRYAPAALIMALLLVTSPRASAGPTMTLLAAGLEGGSGSTVGPGDALFVTESIAGRISRVDPQTGAITTIASGLPTRILGFGGAVDVAFVGDTAYALVTLVGFWSRMAITTACSG